MFTLASAVPSAKKVLNSQYSGFFETINYWNLKNQQSNLEGIDMKY